jgi:hypothetical protein
MEVLKDKLRICHAKISVIARIIEITTKGLRTVHAKISLNEKRIGVPFRIIQQLSVCEQENINSAREI